MAEKLSQERELELIRRIREGDEEALNELAENLIRLVRHIARGFNRWDLLDDLVSVGNIALVKAFGAFNPERGYRVATFAYPYIRFAMLNWLKSEPWQGPSQHEAADDEGGMQELADLRVDLEADLVQGERNELLWRAIRKLPEPKRMIVIMRDFDDFSFEEISKGQPLCDFIKRRAEETGKPQPTIPMPAVTVRTHHLRAHVLLKNWLSAPEKYLEGGNENV